MVRFIAPVFIVLAACGSDPVSYSAPVGINLKAKSADTVGGVVSDDKGITTESGNPYGAFVADATQQLGRAPGAIDVDEVTIFLGANTVGVTALGEIFTGPVEVLFIMNDTNNSYPVAGVAMDAGTTAGPVALDVDFAGVSEVDYPKLLNGSFQVVTRGPAAPSFETKGADADLQVTLTFAAFE